MIVLTMTPERFTTADIHFRKNRINHRILFGDNECFVRLDWQRRLAVFRAGIVIGYERWRANRYGTQSWSIVIGRTVDSGPIVAVDGLRPGLDVWCLATGKTRVSRLFDVLDAMRKQGLQPETIPEYRWRAVHSANLLNRNPAGLVECWSC